MAMASKICLIVGLDLSNILLKFGTLTGCQCEMLKVKISDKNDPK